MTQISLKTDVSTGNGVGSLYRTTQFRNGRADEGGSYLTYRTLMHQAAFARDLAGRGAVSQTGWLVFSRRRPLWAMVLTLLLLPGCNAINPLCGSARPAPVIGSLSSTTITLAQLTQGFVLTVNGKEFVSASVVMINGTAVTTTVVSNVQLQAAIPGNLISAPGTADVTVNTPSGNSGNLGCSSGGTSAALTLTIT